MRKLWIFMFGFIIWSGVFSPNPLGAAESYPNRPVTLMVGYAAGSRSDLVLRALAQVAQKELGQPLVVENRAGSGTAVMCTVLKNSKPDGYTLGGISNSGLLRSVVYHTPYDFLKDFVPIIQIYVGPSVLMVRYDAPWKDFREFLEYVRTNPGKVKYATGGAGLAPHFAMEQLGIVAKVKMVHVPFTGGPEVESAVLGGHTHAGTLSVPPTLEGLVRAKKVRILVAFGSERVPSFPDVPTLKELGIPVEEEGHQFIGAPKGIPKEIVDKLHLVFKKSLDDEGYRQIAKQACLTIKYRELEEIPKYCEELKRRYEDTMKKLGMTRK